MSGKSGTLFSWPTTHPPNPCRSRPSSKRSSRRRCSTTLTDEDIERATLLLGIDTASRHRELYSRRHPGRHPQLGARRRRRQPAVHRRGVRRDDPLGLADRPRHDGRPHQDADARRPDPRRDQAPDEEPVPRHPRLRVGRHVGLVPAARPGDRIYQLRRRGDARRQAVGVRRPLGRSRCAATSRSTSAARSSACTASCAILTERKTARDKGKYADIEPAHYTDDDYERIDAIYAAEQAAGRETRWWEDVNVGDELPPMVKGPLTVTDMIAFHAGGYGFVPYGLRSHGSATRTASASRPST